jgi:prepilin-type N-terminal cleavage/methylation domain-containing protein
MTRFPGQKGFTLVEILIGMLLVGIIASAVTSLTLKVYNSQAENTARIAALRQAENGIQWFHRDAKQAQKIETGSAYGFPLKLSWTDWDGTSTNITYSINNHNLIRESKIGLQNSTLVAASSVSEGPGATSCGISGGMLIVNLTVTSGTTHPVLETRTIEVFPSARIE